MTTIQTNSVRYAQSPDICFGAIDMPEVGAGGLQAVAREAYSELVNWQAQHSDYNVVKIWNFFNEITSGLHDQQRYKQFCVGRAQACKSIWTDRPAAVAIGSHSSSQNLSLIWLACKAPFEAIENPRQTPASCYPTCHTPSPPLFSRASKIGGQLLISGTASIVNHQSLHPGDLAAQFTEILTNLESLTGEKWSVLHSQYAFKVYVKQAALADPLIELFRIHGVSDDRVFLLIGDICRSELLFEIEPIRLNG